MFVLMADSEPSDVTLEIAYSQLSSDTLLVLRRAFLVGVGLALSNSRIRVLDRILEARGVAPDSAHRRTPERP